MSFYGMSNFFSFSFSGPVGKFLRYLLQWCLPQSSFAIMIDFPMTFLYEFFVCFFHYWVIEQYHTTMLLMLYPDFHQLRPLGRVGLVVAKSVCLSLPPGALCLINMR